MYFKQSYNPDGSLSATEAVGLPDPMVDIHEKLLDTEFVTWDDAWNGTAGLVTFHCSDTDITYRLTTYDAEYGTYHGELVA